MAAILLDYILYVAHRDLQGRPRMRESCRSGLRNRYLLWFFGRVFVEAVMVLLILDILMYAVAIFLLSFTPFASIRYGS